MKKLLLLLVLVCIPLVIGANETVNITNNNTLSNQSVWYDDFVNNFTDNDTIGLVSILIGLILVYLLGKFAFKLVKWGIIILAIIIVIKMIF